jgi:hypothetical protein
MSFIAGQAKSANGSVGALADTATIGSEALRWNVTQTLSATLTPIDIVPQWALSLLAGNTHHGSSMGMGAMIDPTGHSAAMVPPTFENNPHNLMLHG